MIKKTNGQKIPLRSPLSSIKCMTQATPAFTRAFVPSLHRIGPFRFTRGVMCDSPFVAHMPKHPQCLCSASWTRQSSRHGSLPPPGVKEYIDMVHETIDLGRKGRKWLESVKIGLPGHSGGFCMVPIFLGLDSNAKNAFIQPSKAAESHRHGFPLPHGVRSWHLTPSNVEIWRKWSIRLSRGQNLLRTGSIKVILEG